MKKILSVTTAVILAFIMVVCQGVPAAQAADEPWHLSREFVKGDAGKQYTIAFSNSFVTNVFRSLCNATFEQAIEELNFNGFIVDGQNDVNKQISDIENLIAQGVDAIICIPYSDAVGGALQQAREQGIFVMLACIPIESNPDSYDVFLGTDMAECTRVMSRALFDNIGGEGNIVMARGTPGNVQSELMREVTWELINTEYPGIKVLDEQFTNSKEDESKMIMTNLLLAYPGQIDAVWTDGAQTAVGCIKAYLDLGEPLVGITGASAYNALFKLYIENRDDNPDFFFSLVPMSLTNSVSDGVRLAYKVWFEGYEPIKQEIQPASLITSSEVEQYVLMDAADAMFVDTDLTPENLAKFLNTQPQS